MSSKATALSVVFKDDVNQEGLVYSGQTLLAPFSQLSTWMLTGTPIKFHPESVMSKVKLPNFVRRTKLLQTISAMGIYSGKSIEELRLEDYSLGLKKPEHSLSGVWRPQTEGSVFGRSSVASNNRTKVAIGIESGLKPQLLFRDTKPEKIVPIPMSTSPSAEKSDVPSQVPNHRFLSTPSINFSSESDPALVFIPPQPSVAEKEPLSSLTDTNRQALMDFLLQSIVKCMQIQNSLHRLMLLKLKSHVTSSADGQTDSHGSRLSKGKLPKASNQEGFSSRSVNNNSSALLCELKEPLEALMQCAGIQRSLFLKLLTVNKVITDVETNQGIASTVGSQEGQDTTPEAQVNMIAVQYNLEDITFKKKMDCSYIRNPFSNFHVAASSEDVVHCRSVNDENFVNDGKAYGRIPNGHGTLKTLDGKLLYSGGWRKGKRHGKGEALIYAATYTVGDSTAQHGHYSGAWKHNMRHGRGKMMFTSGAVYEGQWKFDKMTGFGTLKLPDGTIQEGTWREGSLHGCTVFTWPHGVSEYREYDSRQGQLSSCHIEEETVESISLRGSFCSQLMNLRECVNELKSEKCMLTDQLNAYKEEHVEATSSITASLNTMQERITKKLKHDLQSSQDEFEKKLKDAESKSADRIRLLEKELEKAQNSQQCQICFERPRDCIIMPCTHLLYCRVCVTEHKRKGEKRCPACRGPISGEILCNINL
ncbi:uncharacterized protein [Montipora capricornis]|uniref:uncharacterized protein n=1 Tax=Montipora capricornis TaxID=246305 RepID=UPI0035F16292